MPKGHNRLKGLKMQEITLTKLHMALESYKSVLNHAREEMDNESSYFKGYQDAMLFVIKSYSQLFYSELEEEKEL